MATRILKEIRTHVRTTEDGRFYRAWTYNYQHDTTKAYADWQKIRHTPVTLLSSSFARAFALAPLFSMRPRDTVPKKRRSAPPRSTRELTFKDTLIWAKRTLVARTSSLEHLLVAWMIVSGRRAGETLDRRTQFRTFHPSGEFLMAKHLHKLTDTFQSLPDSRWHAFPLMVSSTIGLRALRKLRSSQQTPQALRARATKIAKERFQVTLHGCRTIYAALLRSQYAHTFRHIDTLVAACLLHTDVNVTVQHYQWISIAPRPAPMSTLLRAFANKKSTVLRASLNALRERKRLIYGA